MALIQMPSMDDAVAALIVSLKCIKIRLFIIFYFYFLFLFFFTKILTWHLIIIFRKCTISSWVNQITCEFPFLKVTSNKTDHQQLASHSNGSSPTPSFTIGTLVPYTTEMGISNWPNRARKFAEKHYKNVRDF